MLSMPQKSRSRRTLTQKNEEKYQRNKEKQEKKISRGLPPPSVLSSLFFSITARQGSNKDSNVFGKNLCWSWSLLSLRTRIHTMALQFRHIHMSTQTHTTMCFALKRRSRTCRDIFHLHWCMQYKRSHIIPLSVLYFFFIPDSGCTASFN